MFDSERSFRGVARVVAPMLLSGALGVSGVMEKIPTTHADDVIESGVAVFDLRLECVDSRNYMLRVNSVGIENLIGYTRFGLKIIEENNSRMVGLTPEQLAQGTRIGGFNRLPNRAVVLEVYGGNSAEGWLVAGPVNRLTPDCSQQVSDRIS